MKNLLCSILVASIVIACGSSPDTASKLNIPKWAVDQPDLCGLGIQKFRGNLSTDRTVANAKARSDLSRQIETKVRSMIKAYAAFAPGGELKPFEYDPGPIAHHKYKLNTAVSATVI